VILSLQYESYWLSSRRIRVSKELQSENVDQALQPSRCTSYQLSQPYGSVQGKWYAEMNCSLPAMPAPPIASNYALNEQWAPLVVHGKRAPLRRKLPGQHKHARKAKRYENEQSEMPNGAHAAFA